MKIAIVRVSSCDGTKNKAMDTNGFENNKTMKTLCISLHSEKYHPEPTIFLQTLKGLLYCVKTKFAPNKFFSIGTTPYP